VGSAIQPLNYACSKTISRTRACIVSFERVFFYHRFLSLAFFYFVAYFLFIIFFGFVSFDEGCLSICKFCLMGGGI
jgi:hypothetical protein